MPVVYKVAFFYLFLPFITIQSGRSQNLLIKSGNVWNGKDFEQRDLFISNGKLVDYRPALIDETIDARGQFVLPAFGDYHTHNFTYDNVESMDSIFLAQGIFYAQDLANDPLGSLKNRSYLNQQKSIDVKFANGCITSSKGHPVEGYERMALGVSWPRNDEERERIANSEIMKGRAYHILDDADQMEEVMNTLLASQPDAVKVILWDSENYDEDDPAANKGINPDFLPEIVRIASNYRLPVVAHVETEVDLKIALKAGVKHFAHSPLYAYGNDGQIDEDFPKLSIEMKMLLSKNDGIIINPTLLRTNLNIKYLPKSRAVNDEQKEVIKEFHRQLLVDLKSTGVTLAIGADSPGLTAVDEAIYYAKLGVFSNKELINLLIQTANIIFPDAKIGSLNSGFDANFMIFEKNPLSDLSSLKKPIFKVKSGIILKN